MYTVIRWHKFPSWIYWEEEVWQEAKWGKEVIQCPSGLRWEGLGERKYLLQESTVRGRTAVESKEKREQDIFNFVNYWPWCPECALSEAVVEWKWKMGFAKCLNVGFQYRLNIVFENIIMRDVLSVMRLVWTVSRFIIVWGYAFLEVEVEIIVNYTQKSGSVIWLLLGFIYWQKASHFPNMVYLSTFGHGILAN